MSGREGDRNFGAGPSDGYFDDASNIYADISARRTHSSLQWAGWQHAGLPSASQLDSRRRYVIPETQSASLEMRHYRLQQSVSPPPTLLRNPANRRDTVERPPAHASNQRDGRSASPPRLQMSQQRMATRDIASSYGPPPPPATAGALPMVSSLHLPRSAPLYRQLEALGTARSGDPGVPAPAPERQAVAIPPIQELYNIRDARENAQRRDPQPPVDAASHQRARTQSLPAPPAVAAPAGPRKGRNPQGWQGFDQLGAGCKHEDGRYYCPKSDCDLSYLDSTRLQRHWRKQHCDGKPFKCTIGECGMRFASGVELSDHIQTHENHGRFVCPGCKAAYKTKKALVEHRQKTKKNPDCKPS